MNNTRNRKKDSLLRAPNKPRKDLLSIEHLALEDIKWIIDKSDNYYSLLDSDGPFPSFDLLRGRTVANLFFESSTRTRISFELAEKRLGATFVSLSPSISSLTKGESLLDTVKVAEAMKLDAIVVRHSASLVPEFIAEHVSPGVHVINAGDGAHEHPTQALLDAATLRKAIGDLKGKHIAIVGDIEHSRVVRSNILLLHKLGAKVSVVGPATLLPRYMEKVFGVSVFSSLDPSLLKCDAIMALRIQMERKSGNVLPSLMEYHERYGLTEKKLSGYRGRILHPGPVNNGIELDRALAHSGNSLILQQVRRGVAIRMAVLEWVFN